MSGCCLQDIPFPLPTEEIFVMPSAVFLIWDALAVIIGLGIRLAHYMFIGWAKVVIGVIGILVRGLGPKSATKHCPTKR